MPCDGHPCFHWPLNSLAVQDVEAWMFERMNRCQDGLTKSRTSPALARPKLNAPFSNFPDAIDQVLRALGNSMRPIPFMCVPTTSPE